MNEIHNPPWAHVKKYAETELSSLRNRLESPATDHDQTQVLRGEIRALKRLLDLPQSLAEARPNPLPFPGTPGSGNA